MRRVLGCPEKGGFVIPFRVRRQGGLGNAFLGSVYRIWSHFGRMTTICRGGKESEN
jgi:hypothetical protein